MMINLTRQEIEAYFEELQTELDYSRYIVLNGKRDDHIHVAVNGIYAEDNTLKNREIKFTYNDSPISEQRFIELLENADTTDIFTQREMHRQYNSNEQNKPTFNVNTPTWSRVMSGDELKDYLGTLGIKQNHGYFILSESDNAAVGLNPTAPSPFVVWEKAQDGGYLSGQYGNNLDYYDSTDLSNLGIEKADAINILHDNGVLYTNAQSANEIIPTWSRIMSNDELVSHLENQGFKQNDGYFIIFENDVTAFAINPMLPDPFIKWDKTADGEYVNGIISNNINEHIQSYQRDYGMSLDSTLNILRESGILYTNKIFESSGMSYADIPSVNSAESINEASREQSQPIAEVQSDELEVHTPVIEQLLEKYPDAKMSDDNYTTSQADLHYNYNETKTNLIKSLTEPKDVFEKQSEIVSTIEQDKPSISNINLYTLDGDSEPKYSIVDQRGNDTLLKRTLSNEVSDPTPFIVATGLVVHDGNVIEWDSGKYCSNLSSAIKAFEPSLDNENSMKTVTEFIDDKVDYWHTHETNTGLQEFLGVNQTDFLYLTEKLGSEQLIKPVIDPSKKTVYVCSPLAGEISVNIAKAREYAKFVAEQGGTPIAPHVTEIFDDLIPAEREMGLAMGIDYLHKADELWVFGDRISSGMAAEIEIAQNELHIPVYQIPAPPYEINPYEKKEELNVAKYNTPRQNVTPEQIALAKQVDLLNYIQTSGFEVKPHGSGTYKLIDDGHDSTIIFPDGNSWFSYNDQVGGDSISFVQRHQNLGFVDAVKALVGEASNFKNIHIPARQTEIKKDMVLPPKDENNNRVFAYLIKTRGIDRDLVKDCIDNGLIYQSKEAIAKGDKSYNFNNCVFVGHDNDGKAQYASQRSMNDDKTVFKADVKNSSKEYGFALAGDDNAEWLTVCEAPIDALSIASMNKSNGDDNKNEHILSLGGVSDKAIDKFLENNDKIKVINICLDNDDAGHQAGNRIKSKYEDLGYKIIESYPKAKDYNLQLLQQRAREDKPNVDLPPPSADNKRVYMHLTQNKHLNKDVIAEMLKNGDIYQTTRQIPNSDKVIADTVFVQKDKDNNPVYGIGVSHNTNLEKADFKIEYQNDEKTSNYISREGNTDTLLVFSNPISMVTQMSIEKDLASINAKNQTHHMICALGKTDDAVLEYLSSHKNIKEVNVSLDTSTGINNKTQQPFDYRESMFNRISKKCATKTVKVSKKFPENKSLNQDYVNCKNKAAQKPQSKNQQSSHIKDDNSLENE